MATKQELPRWHPTYRTAWHRQYQCIPRWARLLAIATVSCFGTLGLLHGLRNLHDNTLKPYSTDFSGLKDRNIEAWIPPTPVRTLNNERHIDDQYHHLRHLGRGAEGTAGLYLDASTGETVVIKTFENIARNEIPSKFLTSEFAEFTTTWPTEIEAGLLLGNGSVGATYVPVIDYFILQNEERWSWALVTPCISGGTLINLAASERRRKKTVAHLDEIYRPMLTHLLAALVPLHAANLCHDDIKPDNTFIEAKDQWLIGDLGGVRHTEHPWHSTATWQIQNQWPDCRLNDIRRTLKTYLWFLREASGDEVKFDLQFWNRSTSWSMMYWNYIQNPVDIESMMVSVDSGMIGATGAQGDGRSITKASMSHESDAELSRATQAELTCIMVPRRLWKHSWWPFWATKWL